MGNRSENVKQRLEHVCLEHQCNGNIGVHGLREWRGGKQQN